MSSSMKKGNQEQALPKVSRTPCCASIRLARTRLSIRSCGTSGSIVRTLVDPYDACQRNHYI